MKLFLERSDCAVGERDLDTVAVAVGLHARTGSFHDAKEDALLALSVCEKLLQMPQSAASTNTSSTFKHVYFFSNGSSGTMKWIGHGGDHHVSSYFPYTLAGERAAAEYADECARKDGRDVFSFLNSPNDQEVAEQPIVVRKNQRNFVQKKVYHSRDRSFESTVDGFRVEMGYKVAGSQKKQKIRIRVEEAVFDTANAKLVTRKWIDKAEAQGGVMTPQALKETVK